MYTKLNKAVEKAFEYTGECISPVEFEDISGDLLFLKNKTN